MDIHVNNVLTSICPVKQCGDYRDMDETIKLIKHRNIEKKTLRQNCTYDYKSETCTHLFLSLVHINFFFFLGGPSF